ncbi:hypothetical protein CANINC_000174 [Pichia inconspicua]|uniref:Required for respiratory growth protein 9, mitochondrial n=1 Tax=Pichia inconspicua TaxID=52247 RepID=A0A4T0X6T9_9ASCO|nr:hypothetical protein CANINC_000174 [[Candida] inconspicua]
MFIQRRLIHASIHLFESGKKRPVDWNLPDLEKLPGGFRGKVYNKKDWSEYLAKNTKILEKEKVSDSKPKLLFKPPPQGWRKNKNLPQWMRDKYALKEKAMKIDLSTVKRLSPATAQAIRTLHDAFPEELPTSKLAEFFKASPVAIAKILKSRWVPTQKEAAKLQERYEKKIVKQVSEKLIENKFEEFIENMETKIKMEIPPFFRQELYEYYKQYGLESVKDDFEKLNNARIVKERLKNEKISKYIEEATNSLER